MFVALTAQEKVLQSRIYVTTLCNIRIEVGKTTEAAWLSHLFDFLEIFDPKSRKYSHASYCYDSVETVFLITQGIFYENDSYALGEKIFRDACVFDGGVIHVYNHYNRVKYERVVPLELLVDEVEGFYG